jgi:hypothetical protein
MLWPVRINSMIMTSAYASHLAISSLLDALDMRSGGIRRSANVSLVMEVLPQLVPNLFVVAVPFELLQRVGRGSNGTRYPSSSVSHRGHARPSLGQIPPALLKSMFCVIKF